MIGSTKDEPDGRLSYHLYQELFYEIHDMMF